MYLPYQDLEFGKILRQISQRCDSLLARELAEGLVPLSSLPLIRQELAINDEFTSACEHGYGFDFSHLTSLDPLFVEKQVLIFDYEELLVIYQNALLGNLVHQGLGNCEHYPRILKLAKKLVPLPEITQRFVQIFDPEGEILDGASPELSKIRKSINGLRSRIIRTMQSLIQDSSLEKFLQDKFVTQRNDRYVLPIKDTCSSQVKGIVQGQSAKGSTIFVEPESVVPMSNELQLLIQEEKREIYRILSIYSDVINAASGYLLDNTSLLSEFDLRFAIGKLSRELHSEVPEIGEEPYLDLKAARHPLLILKLDDFSRVIPFELELGKDKDILIVSGPNTGGKTVLLKAVGLITLMALSGLPVPVDKKSKIGYFEPVYADVGDDQSIENALSAFSAHLDKIRRMIGNCGRQTLILIDEIGAATDPTQGSALAQAMLEHFISCQVKGIVTTHYTALKILGEQTERCANASMQFDLKSMLPTYRFVYGFPGDSFAIEVAASMGFAGDLIERARSLAGNQSMEFTALLKSMQEEKKALARASYEYELKARNLQARIDELAQKNERFEQELKEHKKRFLKEMQNELTAQQKLILNELDEIRQLDKDARKTRSEKKLDAIQSHKQALDKDMKQLSREQLEALAQPREGDKVYLQDFDAEAIILEIKGKEAVVDMNGISFKTPVSSLFKCADTGKAPQKNTDTKEVKTSVHASYDARIELKLLGYTFDEARPLIDDFIDNAVFAGLHRLRIVHGKGTGALRTKIQSYLKKKKEVKDIATPPIEYGGSGVTVISV